METSGAQRRQSRTLRNGLLVGVALAGASITLTSVLVPALIESGEQRSSPATIRFAQDGLMESSASALAVASEQGEQASGAEVVDQDSDAGDRPNYFFGVLPRDAPFESFPSGNDPTDPNACTDEQLAWLRTHEVNSWLNSSQAWMGIVQNVASVGSPITVSNLRFEGQAFEGTPSVLFVCISDMGEAAPWDLVEMNLASGDAATLHEPSGQLPAGVPYSRSIGPGETVSLIVMGVSQALPGEGVAYRGRVLVDASSDTRTEELLVAEGIIAAPLPSDAVYLRLEDGQLHCLPRNEYPAPQYRCLPETVTSWLAASSFQEPR